AVRALGASVEDDGGVLTIRGVGLRGARVPDTPIDVGNAGTLMRLLPGWLAAQDGRAFVLDGDDSIRRRPVDRIATPLRQMGATIDARDGRLPPFTVTGGPLHGITYALPVASAQIKSAVALAALGDELTVPGDPSSAAFAVAAALLVPGARVVVRGASTNWTRTGFVRIAQRMGGRIEGPLEEAPGEAIPHGDPIGDLEVAGGPLRATTVEADEVPLAIDELPLVALLGCFAEGETVVRGAAELRLKETDRSRPWSTA